jgi:hypothetical protein
MVLKVMRAYPPQAWIMLSGSMGFCPAISAVGRSGSPGADSLGPDLPVHRCCAVIQKLHAPALAGRNGSGHRCIGSFDPDFDPAQLGVGALPLKKTVANQGLDDFPPLLAHLAPKLRLLNHTANEFA